MTDNVLKKFYAGLSAKFDAQRNLSANFDHSLEQGLSNERCLLSFLKELLPKKYSIASGKIIDSRGRFSDQMDIIIYDAFHSSPVYLENGFTVVSLESVYGAIEVKTTFQSSSVKDVVKKATSISKLDELPLSYCHTALDRPTSDCMCLHNPIFACFAFNSNVSAESLFSKSDFLKHLHILCVLNQGCVVSAENFTKSPCDKSEAFVYFFCSLVSLLNRRVLKPISVYDYYKPPPRPKRLW